MRVLQNQSRPPTCFFCLTNLSTHPRNSRSFRCPHCLCWNRYDDAGQILSDEPAMRDESLNASSFAKRASPSKQRFPTSFGKGPFCHTCLTNQTLLVNLLSNYLPSSDDPSYEARVAELPAYTTSLQSRYPPVCSDCQPTVDEELRKKEHMARTTALGGWLKRSQNIGAQRLTEQRRGRRGVILWKLRGALWIITLAIFVITDIAGALRYDVRMDWLALILPAIVPTSLLWTFWDPTWSSVRLSRLHGRAFSVSGRERYIRYQMIIWLSRLVTSALVAIEYRGIMTSYITPYGARYWYATAFGTEVMLTVVSLGRLHVERPTTVKLIEPRSLKSENTHDSLSTSSSRQERLLSNLSATTTPPSTLINPIFGQSSFPSPVPDVPEEDLMDWTPTNPQGAVSERVQDREGWMRPQRFFPPEQPTGLEDLFEKAKLDVEEHVVKQNQQHQETGKWSHEVHKLDLFLAATVVIALIAGLAVIRFQGN